MPPSIDVRRLARARQIHTAGGKHVRELSSWRGAARAGGVKPLAPAAAMRAFEACLGDAAERLPWRAPPQRRKR